MANKMRSGLSTLGIMIGMTSVIVMMAIGQWAESSLMKNMGDLVKNKITVRSDWGYNKWDEETNMPGAYVKRVTFTPEIIDYIEYYFPHLKGRMTYTIHWWGEVKIRSKTNYVSSLWVPKNWFTLNERTVVEGVGLTDEHYQNKAFVAVVNDKFKEEFFKNTSAIGKKFMFERKQYTIVWVLKKQDYEWSSEVYIPDTTVFERVTRTKEIREFEVFLDPQDDNALRKKRLSYLLLKKYNQSHLASAGFRVDSFADFAESLKKSSDTMKYFLLAIGAISLFVWGIGVMNIMIVSVTERTREIWIRKAIGALNRDIVIQFLVESVVITLIGGLIAFGLSHGIIILINKFLWGSEWAGFEAIIDATVALLAFWLTAFTGIVFGILPARKAAKLKPIDALRFE